MCAHHLCFHKLHVSSLLIVHELFMAALLQHPPLAQHCNDVCALYGAEAVCNDQAGAPSRQGGKGSRHQRLTAGVKGGGGLI